MQYVTLFFMISLGFIQTSLACNKDANAELKAVIQEWVLRDAEITHEERSKYWEIIRELLDKGADAEVFGLLPLQYAALTGHTEYLAEFFKETAPKKSCDINLALNHALFSCQSDAAALLVAWGADLNYLDKAGNLEVLIARPSFPESYALFESWSNNNTQELAKNLTSYAMERNNLLLLRFMLEAPVTKGCAAKIIFRSAVPQPILFRFTIDAAAMDYIPQELKFHVALIMFELEKQRFGGKK